MTRLNGAWKPLGLALTVVAMIVTAVLGYADVRSRSEENARAIERVDARKASRETVDTQYEAILRELQQMNRRLDRMEVRP